MLQRACLRASECLESAEASLGTSWMPGCTPRMHEDARGIVNALHASVHYKTFGHIEFRPVNPGTFATLVFVLFEMKTNQNI